MESNEKRMAADAASAAAPAADQGEAFIRKAYELFEEYHSAYKAEWTRLDDSETLYRAKHWDNMSQSDSDPNVPKPTTPILHSTVENIAADLMDRIPMAVILPESPEDEEVAAVVGALMEQNHDVMGYPKEYQKTVHDLLVGGYCVQEVGYDALANRGIGAAFIRHVDNRSILFDPQCDDIQDGRGIFKIAPRTVQWLEMMYPQFAGQFGGDEYDVRKDPVVTFDPKKSLLLIEYWWREFDAEGGTWRVHMAKLAGRKLLEDSREVKPEGYFAHGQYPFIVTPLFMRKGSALGYGFADVFGGQQKYADKMDQYVMKNACLSSRNKLLVTEASGFDPDDLRDWTKEVHRGESLNGVTWFGTPALPAYMVTLGDSIRNNVKEESGANDFSRGNTAAGVTAASAIASLQEMSNKRARTISRLLHEAFRDAVRMEIETEREFNELPRAVLVTIDGVQRKATFDSAQMNKTTELGNDVPIEFYITIKVQQETRWQIQSHNEFILAMVDRAMIDPAAAVELMVFDGKEDFLNKTRKAQQAQQEQVDPAAEEQLAMQAAMTEQMQQMPAPDALA